jgi:DNA modification methylase
MTEKNATIEVKVVKISDIKSNPNNPRIIKDDKFKKLVESIKGFPEMANVRPIVVNTDMIVLGGNMRLKAMKEAGWKEAPIQIVDWDEQKQKEFIVKDNVGFGEWDWDDLANNWEVEELTDWGLDIPNFDATVLEAEEDDFAVPDGGIETDIVLGDLFEIGEHRLLCGDSTDSDQVAKLMNGEKADMVFTDPPYGISVVKNDMVGADFGIAKKGHYKPIANDETKDVAQEFYQTCVSLGMDNFIIWGGNYFTDFLPFSDGWLIWNKRAGTDIRNTFADGEMAWCSFHTPIRIYDQLWNGMIREGEKEKRVHPTQKPIRTLAEIIEDHIKGKIIYDGFLGSGSTMVATHQKQKICYGVEMSPDYCQVIIDRMKNLDPTLVIKKNGVPL